jgi:predicted neuraminidase
MSASAKRRAEVQITDKDGTDSCSGDEDTNDENKVVFYDKKWEKADATTLAARR